MGVDEPILPKELDWSRTPLNNACESSWLHIDGDSLHAELGGPNELFCFEENLEGSLSCDMDGWAELDSGTVIDPIEQMESGSWQWEDDAAPSAPGLQEREAARPRTMGCPAGSAMAHAPAILRLQAPKANACAGRSLSTNLKPMSFGHLGSLNQQSKARQELKDLVKIEATETHAARKGSMVMHFANHPIRAAQATTKHSLNASLEKFSAHIPSNIGGSLPEKLAAAGNKGLVVEERAKRSRPLCITYCDGMSSSKDVSSYRQPKQPKISEKLLCKPRSYAPARVDMAAGTLLSHSHEWTDSSVTVLPTCKFVSKRVGTTCEHPPIKSLHKRGHLSVACSAGHQWVWCAECCNCTRSCTADGQRKRGCTNPVHWFERDAFDTGKRNHMNRHRK